MYYLYDGGGEVWGSDQGFVGMNEWRIVADLFGSTLLESLHNLPTISP